MTLSVKRIIFMITRGTNLVFFVSYSLIVREILNIFKNSFCPFLLQNTLEYYENAFFIVSAALCDRFIMY